MCEILAPVAHSGRLSVRSRPAWSKKGRDTERGRRKEREMKYR